MDEYGDAAMIEKLVLWFNAQPDFFKKGLPVLLILLLFTLIIYAAGGKL